MTKKQIENTMRRVLNLSNPELYLFTRYLERMYLVCNKHKPESLMSCDEMIKSLDDRHFKMLCKELSVLEKGNYDIVLL